MSPLSPEEPSSWPTDMGILINACCFKLLWLKAGCYMVLFWWWITDILVYQSFPILASYYTTWNYFKRSKKEQNSILIVFLNINIQSVCIWVAGSGLYPGVIKNHLFWKGTTCVKISIYVKNSILGIRFIMYRVYYHSWHIIYY